MEIGGGGSFSLEAVTEYRNAMLEGLEAVDVNSAAPDQLGSEIKLIRSTIDLLELQQAKRLARFDEKRGCYALGQHTTIDWLRANTHVSAASADKQLTLARQLDTLLPTVEAVEQGGISFQHALQLSPELQG